MNKKLPKFKPRNKVAVAPIMKKGGFHDAKDKHKKRAKHKQDLHNVIKGEL